MIPTVNIATNPHPISIIDDQLNFITHSLNTHGLAYQTSRSLSSKMLNIVIEGFDLFNAENIARFCVKFNKKIAVVMTEHIEINHDNLLIVNENQLFSNNEYMPYAAMRFEAICKLIPHIQFFIILGHLPYKKNITKIFKNIPVIEINYPEIEFRTAVTQYKNDFIFQGSLTNYRTSMLKKISKRFPSLLISFKDNSNKRETVLLDSKYSLQIPQYKNWRHISPMRCLYSLKNGVVTLNISDYREHDFDDIFPRINPNRLEDELSTYLSYPVDMIYQQVLDKYNAFVKQQKQSKISFMLKFWSELEHHICFQS